MTDDTKQEPFGHSEGIDLYAEGQRAERERMTDELAALRAALEFERVAVKLACGESVDLRAERDELAAELEHIKRCAKHDMEDCGWRDATKRAEAERDELAEWKKRAEPVVNAALDLEAGTGEPTWDRLEAAVDAYREATKTCGINDCTGNHHPHEHNDALGKKDA